VDNVDHARALLAANIDAEQYWSRCGQAQMGHFGLLLNDKQRVRAVKGLNRLAARLRAVGFTADAHEPSGNPTQWAEDFARYLASHP
jgi:hypothetical protein